MLLAVLFGIGVLCLWFMIKKSVPAPAAASQDNSINKQEAVFIDGTSGKLGGDMFRFSTAQAIHKNLVKVPEYCFDNIKSCPAFGDYLYGQQCVGIVAESVAVEVKGIKGGTRLYYSDELGLVIEKSS